MGERKQMRCKVLKNDISPDRIGNFMRDVFENYAELDERFFNTPVHYHKKGKFVKLTDHYFLYGEMQNEDVLFAAMMSVPRRVSAIPELPFTWKHRSEKKGTKHLDFWVCIPKGMPDKQDIVLLIEYKHASVSFDRNRKIGSINDVKNKLSGLQQQYKRLGKEAYDEFVDWDEEAKSRRCFIISLLSITLAYKLGYETNEQSSVNNRSRSIERRYCEEDTTKVIQKLRELRKYKWQAIWWLDTKLQEKEFRAEEETAQEDARGKNKKRFKFKIHPAVLLLARVYPFRY